MLFPAVGVIPNREGVPPISASRVSESSAGPYFSSADVTVAVSDNDSKKRHWLSLEDQR